MEKNVAEHITSIKDPRIMEARELNSASGRARQHKCLLEGVESLQWALETDMEIDYVLYSTAHEQHALNTQLREHHIPCYTVTEGVLKKISDTSYVVPYFGVAHIPEAANTSYTMGDFVVVLDRVQDHGNIGTIIRTASAFGISDIVSTTPELDLYYKKIVTASRGRAYTVRLRRFASGIEAIRALQEQGYQVIATSPYARTLQAQAPLQAKPIALIVGNETTGSSDEVMRVADSVVQIPMSGLVESLNVGVATGISLYELKFRMIITMLTNYIRATLGRQVNATSQLIRQVFAFYLQQVSDLSSMQVVLLMILKCDQTMLLEQVSQDTATTSEELSALLTPLFEHGYIRHLPDDTGRIMLTEEGEHVIAQLWSVIERAENEMLAGFSEHEKAQFNSYLERIQANCIRVTT